MRVEQERIRLLARLEELIAQQDLVIYPSLAPHNPLGITNLINFQDNVSGSSLDECARYGEHATSPPSSSGSTKIGSASIDKPAYKRRQLEAVVIPSRDKPSKAPGPRKSIGKPSACGTKTQTKTAANTTRPVKDKATPKQKPTQNPEGSATKDPTQRVIRRVHAVVEVPIKVEDDEDEFMRTPVNDTKGRAPSDKDPKPSTTIKKAKPAEPPRAKNKSWQVYRDNDATPPALAPAPRRRKSGMDQDYYEPDEDTQNRRSQGNADVKQRPPSRRKSIRELRESDFEYREEDEEEETDADEMNLGVRIPSDGRFYGSELSVAPSFLQRSFEQYLYPEKPAKQQRVNEAPSNAPARKNGRKRKAVDVMDVDEPVVSGRGPAKAVKTR